MKSRPFPQLVFIFCVCCLILCGGNLSLVLRALVKSSFEEACSLQLSILVIPCALPKEKRWCCVLLKLTASSLEVFSAYANKHHGVPSKGKKWSLLASTHIAKDLCLFLCTSYTYIHT